MTKKGIFSAARYAAEGLSAASILAVSSTPFAADPDFPPLVGDTSLVASIPGQFTVTPSGAAQYSAPIVVSPGTAGVAPSLSITYDSGSNSGLMGVGWSVSGLSSIHRCSQTLAQDGQRTAVELDSSDRFCIDGQRLLAVTGVYGSDHTEYRTEIDTFSKVVSYGNQGGGPAYFKVWTKAGEIREYGVSSDARVEAEGHGSNGVVQHWALNKVEDTKGNYFTISYHEDHLNGEHYPLRIDYTGNTLANLTPFASITYEYEDRPDSSFGYLSGSKISSNKRLASLSSYDGASLLRRYQFDYYATDLKNPRSRLAQIRMCTDSAATQCVAPTRIEWQKHDFAFDSEVAIPDTGELHSEGYLAARILDFNGDGITDLLYAKDNGRPINIDLYGYDGLVQQQITLTDHVYNTVHKDIPLVMDYDGDGKTDLLFPSSTVEGYPDPEFESNPVNWVIDWTLIQHNGATYAESSVTLQSGLDVDRIALDLYDRPTLVLDVNGDGLHDLLYAPAAYVGASTTTMLLINRGDGQPFDEVPLPQLLSNPKSYRVLDANGDGLQDLFQVNDVLYLSTGEGFEAVSLNWSNPDVDETALPVDINGDGHQDMVWFDHDQVYYRLNGGGTVLAQGGSFMEQRSAPVTVEVFSYFGGTGVVPLKIDDERLAHYAKAADINNDGLTDILMPLKDAPNWWALIAMRDGLDGVRFEALDTGIPKADAEPHKGLQLGDFNGDGLQDALYVSQRQWQRRLGSGKAGDRVNRITASLGHGDNQIEIDYAALTQPGVHTTSVNALTPRYRDLSAPLLVVNEVRQSNGIGGLNSKNYTYAGAKLDTHGRGFLGFASQTVIDNTTNVVETTDYQQTFPGIGLPLSKTRKLNNVLVGHETYNPGYNWQGVVNNSPVFVFTDQSINRQYDPETGNLLSTVTTDNTYGDAYGNVTRVQVETVDHINTQTTTKTTINTYDNDTAQWQLGRLRTAEVAHQGGQYGSTRITRQSAFDYDSDGLLKQEQIITADDTLTKDYTLDGFGNTREETVSGDDITSRTTQSPFDAKGRYPDSGTNALGHTETYQHNDPYGNRTQLTGPNNLTTTWSYDSLGRVTQEIRANQTGTTTEYYWCDTTCPVNAVYYTFTTSSGSADTWQYFDSLDREIRTLTKGFGGEDVIADTQYDGRGRAFKVSRPYFSTAQPQWTTTLYDAADRPVQVTSPVTGITTTDYDHLTVLITNALGQTTTEQQNVLGQRLQVTDADGGVMQYEYDAVGNLTRTTDPAGNQIINSYNVRGEKIAMLDPDMGAWSYDYNVLGELIWQKDGKQQITQMSYDKLGRLTRRWSSAYNHEDKFTYDTQANGIGKLASATAGSIGSTTPDYARYPEYDNLGRPRLTQTRLAGTTYYDGYVYDGYSRVKQRHFAGGRGVAVQYTYNAHGYLSHVTDLSDGALHWEGVSANADGAMTTQRVGGIDTVQQYDSAGRIESIMTGQGNLQDNGYHFDALGNLELRQDHRQNLREDFGYDDLNRLKTINQSLNGVSGSRTFDYDSLGNLKRKDNQSYTYDPARPHAVANKGGVAYDYDANGNLDSDDTGRSFTWSYDNKPTRIQKLSTTLDFAYGPERARYRQVVDNGATTEETHYMGDYERRITDNFRVEHRHRIAAGDRQVAIKIVETHGAPIGDPRPSLPSSDVPAAPPSITPPTVTPPLPPDPSENEPGTGDAGIPTKTQNGLYVVTFRGDVILIDGTKTSSELQGIIAAQESTSTLDKTPGALIFKSATTTSNRVTLPLAEVAPVQVTNGPDGSTLIAFGGEQQSGQVYPVDLYESGGQLWVSYQQPDTEPAPTPTPTPVPNTDPEQHDGQALEGQVIVHYLHLDHLGSVEVITNQDQQVIERTSYEAFGLRRQSNWQSAAAPLTAIENRGFTGHEHLEQVGIIHMNGRIYDPNLGRFLSADPHIQFPNNLQSFNRYSYVLNNPLSYTDPSGYFIEWLIAIGSTFVADTVAIAAADALVGTSMTALTSTAYTATYAAVYAGTAAVIGGVAAEALGGTSAEGFRAGLFVGVGGAFSGGVPGPFSEMV
ncbi:MAG: RHS repeat-associated core domain-containing protein, partial [bacterium]